MKKLPLLLSALFSTALLGSCGPLHADIRPEVAQPLDEARVIANAYGGTSDKARIEAKLNRAASVPNLNKDEVHQIRATGEYVFARAANAGAADPYVAIAPPLFSESSPPSTSSGVGYTGLH
jgi:hypothetical protein